MYLLFSAKKTIKTYTLIIVLKNIILFLFLDLIAIPRNIFRYCKAGKICFDFKNKKTIFIPINYV